MHHGVPQVTTNFPEYRKINDEFEIAILIDRLSAPAVAGALNLLLKNKDIYERLRENCLKARAVFSWENEEKTLLDFYRKIESDMQQ